MTQIFSKSIHDHSKLFKNDFEKRLLETWHYHCITMIQGRQVSLLHLTTLVQGSTVPKSGPQWFSAILHRVRQGLVQTLVQEVHSKSLISANWFQVPLSRIRIQTKNFNLFRKWVNEYWGILLWRCTRIMRF